ncbi:hypothetical protein IQ07DRAFT_600386 [Pyrenochaeta sp. DS3sAY3a]|nr:hypothetical protein IQ07DRAFT_600386 [Pyrenochaeta sp. DS3sAY3a]
MTGTNAGRATTINRSNIKLDHYWCVEGFAGWPSTRSKSANSSARSNDGRVSSLDHVEGLTRCAQSSVSHSDSRFSHGLLCRCLYVMSAVVLKGALDAPARMAVSPSQASHFHPANVPGELKEGDDRGYGGIATERLGLSGAKLHGDAAVAFMALRPQR